MIIKLSIQLSLLMRRLRGKVNWHLTCIMSGGLLGGMKVSDQMQLIDMILATTYAM